MSAIRNRDCIMIYSGLLLWLLLNWKAAIGNDVSDWAELPNFDEIRQERGARDDFRETCGLDGRADPEDPTVSLLNDEKWEAAASTARARLESCPVDIGFHRNMAVALQNLGRESESKVHIAWYNGLIDSILGSGDGRTVESAFVTISIAEEYEVLFVFGLEPTKQALVRGRDRFEVTDEAGREHVIYFFPELHWARLAKLFPE